MELKQIKSKHIHRGPLYIILVKDCHKKTHTLRRKKKVYILKDKYMNLENRTLELSRQTKKTAK